MNLQSVSIEQLKQIISIKEEIGKLEQQLAKLIGGKAPAVTSVAAAPAAAPAKKGRKKMSAAGKAKIAAAQKARWAKVKGLAAAPAPVAAPKAAAPVATKPAKPAKAAKPAKKAKRTLSPEGRARIVAALKKRWAAKKK